MTSTTCLRTEAARSLSLAGSALSVTLVLAQPASGQSVQASGLTFEAPAPRMSIKATMEGRYDSNVARTGDAAIEQRDLEKADFIVSPSLNVDISVPTAAANLLLVGYAGYDFYLRNSRLNRERIDLKGSAQRRVAICDMTVSAGINRRQTDLGDLALIPGGGKGATVNVESQWSVGGIAACGPPVGFQPMAYASYREIRNSAQVRKANDANDVEYGGGVTYSSPAFGKLSAFAGRSEFKYPLRGLGGPFPGSDEFNLTYYGGKLDRRLGARLQAQIQVTYVDVSMPGAQVSRFDGLNWDISAQLRVGASTLLTATTSRVLGVAAGFQSDFAKSTIYSAKVERAISPITRIALAASRRERDFAQSTPLTGVLVADDRTDEVRASVSYDRFARLNLTAFTRYQKRNSEVKALDYESLQVGIVAALAL